MAEEEFWLDDVIYRAKRARNSTPQLELLQGNAVHFVRNAWIENKIFAEKANYLKQGYCLEKSTKKHFSQDCFFIVFLLN